MERPSKKQHELLNFIDGFIKGNGYGPSYREIMRALDYKSVSTVAVHINGLIARGWLVKKTNSARSLEVVTLQATRPVVSIEKSVEAEIVKKIESLRAMQQDDNVEKDITTLVEALRVLGFDSGAEPPKV